MNLQRELPNGLRLYLEPAPPAHSVAMGFLVLAGSRHEPAELSGVGHFVEHLCFKGSRDRSGEELAQAVDSIGAQWNGSTSWEGASYYLWTPSERIADALDLLVDLIHPAFRKEDFDLEKQVILEEIAACEDTPDERVIDELFAAVYGGHPMGQRMMGAAESVARIQRSDVVRHHRTHYRPNRMIFVAVGRFDPEDLAEGVRLKCGRWQPGASTGGCDRPQFRKQIRTIQDPKFGRGYLALAVPGPRRSSRLAPVATLLASYLGSEDNSRLFWSIRQKGLADEVWADYEGFSDSGLLYGYAAIERESVDLARRRMATEFALLQKKLDLGLFERAQSKILTDTVCERESPLERFDAVVSLLTAHGRPKTLEAEVAEYQRVTDRDVRTFLEKYPTDRGIACVVMKGSRDDNP